MRYPARMSAPTADGTHRRGRSFRGSWGVVATSALMAALCLGCSQAPAGTSAKRGTRDKPPTAGSAREETAAPDRPQAAGTGPAGSSASGVSRRPSILLVTIDTWRSDALGASGSGRVVTPRLDAIAKEG